MGDAVLDTGLGGLKDGLVGTGLAPRHTRPTPSAGGLAVSPPRPTDDAVTVVARLAVAVPFRPPPAPRLGPATGPTVAVAFRVAALFAGEETAATVGHLVSSPPAARLSSTVKVPGRGASEVGGQVALAPGVPGVCPPDTVDVGALIPGTRTGGLAVSDGAAPEMGTTREGGLAGNTPPDARLV